MKKVFIVITMILLACFIFAGCGPFDYVNYCPYCSSSVSEIDTNVFKCQNSNCGRTFGAKEL